MIAPVTKGKELRGSGNGKKVPEQYPRHNKGKPPKNGTGPDIARIQRSSCSGDLAYLPMVITPRDQPDFPLCGGCLCEKRIQQDGPGVERKIACPKSPMRVRHGRGDWVWVRSGLATECDKVGSAAAIALREQEEQEEEAD